MPDDLMLLLCAAALGFAAMALVQALFRRFVIRRHMSTKSHTLS
jgi:hypothetical protein